MAATTRGFSKEFLEELPTIEDAIWMAQREMNEVAGAIDHRVDHVPSSDADVIKKFMMAEARVNIPLTVLVRLLINKEAAEKKGIHVP